MSVVVFKRHMALRKKICENTHWNFESSITLHRYHATMMNLRNSRVLREIAVDKCNGEVGFQIICRNMAISCIHNKKYAYKPYLWTIC